MMTTPLILIALSCDKAPPAATADTDPTLFVADVNRRMDELYRENSEAHWQHETDITDEHEAAAAASDELLMAYQTAMVTEATKFGTVADPDVARSLHLLKVNQVLAAPSDAEKRKRLAELSTGLSSTYGTGKWCPEGQECKDLGELEDLLAHSRDPAEQLAAWKGWHDIATPMRPDYVEMVGLANQGASEIGFANTGELWKSGYDMTPPELEAEVDRLWKQVEPLYEALHCHVRAKLSEQYGPDVVPPTGPIPAHLLGNMWAQDWANLYPMLVPYPDEPGLDVTQALVDQGWDDQRMTKTAEAFFVGLGMPPLPDSFWTKSLFLKPADREVVCHAS
ncbi:MAG: M2 family metallopeptidase, partial [Myxococcales bacterium]|nr:M2 family metallopeptidase [Myxococcales bacterium]